VLSHRHAGLDPGNRQECKAGQKPGPSEIRGNPCPSTTSPATQHQIPALSFAARVGDLLFISGIPGFDDNGGLPDRFETQPGGVSEA